MICLVRLRHISPKLGDTNRKRMTVLQISSVSGPASETVISHYLYLKYIAFVAFMLLQMFLRCQYQVDKTNIPGIFNS